MDNLRNSCFKVHTGEIRPVKACAREHDDPDPIITICEYEFDFECHVTDDEP